MNPILNNLAFSVAESLIPYQVYTYLLTNCVGAVKRLFSGQFDNAGAVMSVDENLLCRFQILKPMDKKKKIFGN